MFDYKLVRVEKKLYQLFQKGLLNNRKIYVFGVSENTRQIIQILRSYHLEPVNVLDNDKKKQNTYCSGVRVISLEDVKSAHDRKNLYIVYSLYWPEMTAQLRDKNVSKRNILMLYQEETLGECLLQAYKGKHIHDRLRRKYGDVPVFLCPYTGTGDIYLIGTFWRQYIEKTQLENYVFLVLSKACEKVARLFEIKNLEMLPKKAESEYLIRNYKL